MRFFNNRPGITYDPENVYVLYAEDLNEFVSELQSLQTSYPLMQTDLVARIGTKKLLVSSSNISKTSGTLAIESSLGIDLLAGRTYMISMRGFYQSGVTTTGAKFGVALSNGSATVLGDTFAQREGGAGTSVHQAAIRAISTNPSSSGSQTIFPSVIDINSPLLFGFNIWITPTEDCTFYPTFATEVTNSEIIYLSGIHLMCYEHFTN